MVLSRQADLSEIQSKLMPWLREKMPQAQNLSISGMKRPEAGWASDTFVFDLSWDEAGQHRSQGMVLRRSSQPPLFPDHDLRRQFRVMECLQGTDIPVPKVYWLERDEGILGAPFYIMGKIEGVIPSDYPVYHSFGVYHDATPEQRAKMWWGCVEAMAKIHQLDWRSLGVSFLGVPKEGTSTLDGLLDYYKEYLNWVKEDPQEPQPILEAALEWLKENRYTPEHLTLCWGDSRMSNIIYSPDFEVLAVLDWEIAYLGDPECELGWLLFLDWSNSEANSIPRLEGTPGTEETVQRYEELTGWKVRNLFYNEVLAAVRLGVTMLKMYKNMKKAGIPLAPEDIELNNFCTQRLASQLNLPPPGPSGVAARLEEVTVTAQFHLTGPGGRDWYLVSDRGKVTVYEGTVENPNVTLTVSAEDWEAIQRGELGRTEAWLTGKLKMEGDMGLLMQLEGVLSNLGGAN